VVIQATAFGVACFALWLGGFNRLLVVVYAVASAVSLVVSARWRGLELFADGAIVRRNTKRVVSWSEVTDVRPGTLLSTRFVVLDTPRGPVRCWAPIAGPLAPDRDFESKLAYIRQWWWSSRPQSSSAPALWPSSNATGWGIPVVVEPGSETDRSAV
jgi:hypothetical protein